MPGLLSYFKPASSSAPAQNTLSTPSLELTESFNHKIVHQGSPHTLDLGRLNAFPVGDFRNASAEDINDVKCEVMVNYLHSQQEEKHWISGDEDEGVILKKSRGTYTCAPVELATDCAILLDAVAQLNVRVSFWRALPANPDSSFFRLQ
jgi:hypothetical protein